MLVRNLPLFIFHVCIAGGACSEPELLELGMKGEYNRERLCEGVDNEWRKIVGAGSIGSYKVTRWIENRSNNRLAVIFGGW